MTRMMTNSLVKTRRTSERSGDQLMDLGFSEEQCLQAYLLCNKNPDQAVNYLLDEVERDEE